MQDSLFCCFSWRLHKGGIFTDMILPRMSMSVRSSVYIYRDGNTDPLPTGYGAGSSGSTLFPPFSPFHP